MFSSPCSIGHDDGKCVIKQCELVGFVKLGVDVDAFIETVHSLHFDLLHCVLTGSWEHTQKKLDDNKMDCTRHDSHGEISD